MNRLLLFTVLTLLSFSFAAQNVTKSAQEYFNDGDFNNALVAYQKMLKTDPENVKYNYRVGVCYLNTNIDKSNAIPYFEKVIDLKDENPNNYYLLGRAYHYGYQFKKAISMYEKFKSLKDADPVNVEDADRQIEYCYNAIEIMKFPVDVTFENLGQTINTKYPDYYPFVPKDESFLIFNSKRNDGGIKQSDGSYLSEVYMAKTKNGKYLRAEKIAGDVNKIDASEEIVGMSDDGRYILLYYYNDLNYGDLFLAEFNDNEAINIEKLPKVINSKDYEIAASISNSGDAIYFASNREGGYGGVDLYVSKKLPNGKWGPAQNLGASVNTKFDEDFPNISPDGKTLYFSSKGHVGMGGYDIFKSSWDAVKRKWSSVKNIGYPINTPEDNMNFRASENGRTGYISALRGGGEGDLDIYSITFNQEDPDYTVLKGYIKGADKGTQIDNVDISITDLQTDEFYGSYLPNPISGRYIIILPPGKFNLLVDVPGYQFYTEFLEVYGKNSQRSLIKKDIVLKPEIKR